MLNHHISYLVHIDKDLSFFELNFMFDATLKRILKTCSTQTSQINLLNASLILLAFALVIGPIKTCNESRGGSCWYSSSLLSLKNLILNCHLHKKRKIRNIECSTNIILTWKIQLIFIVVDPFKNMKWTIPFLLQLRSHMSWKYFLPYIHLNPIIRFKDNTSTTLVGFRWILLNLLFYLQLNTLMKFLHQFYTFSLTT